MARSDLANFDEESDRIAESDLWDESLSAFLALWHSRCRGQLIPARDTLTPEDLRPWFGSILIMDVLDAAADFRHRLVGTTIVEMVGRDLTGRLVSECHYEVGTETMLRRYRRAALEARPICRRGRVLWPANREWLAFESVTVPFSRDGSTADQLMSVIRFPQRQPPLRRPT